MTTVHGGGGGGWEGDGGEGVGGGGRGSVDLSSSSVQPCEDDWGSEWATSGAVSGWPCVTFRTQYPPPPPAPLLLFSFLR